MEVTGPKIRDNNIVARAIYGGEWMIEFDYGERRVWETKARWQMVTNLDEWRVPPPDDNEKHLATHARMWKQTLNLPLYYF